MDVRDLHLWLREVQIRELENRAERYAASLLPHRNTEDVNKELKRIEYEFYELEHEDEIDAIEEDVRKHMKKRRKQQ